MKDCLFSGLVGCGRFHQFGYRILAALSWGSTIDTHPLRDMNRAGGGKHPAVSEVHRVRDLLFAHCEPDDLTVVSVLRGWLDRKRWRNTPVYSGGFVMDSCHERRVRSSGSTSRPVG